MLPALDVPVTFEAAHYAWPRSFGGVAEAQAPVRDGARGMSAFNGCRFLSSGHAGSAVPCHVVRLIGRGPGSSLTAAVAAAGGSVTRPL